MLGRKHKKPHWQLNLKKNSSSVQPKQLQLAAGLITWLGDAGRVEEAKGSGYADLQNCGKGSDLLRFESLTGCKVNPSKPLHFALLFKSGTVRYCKVHT